MAGFAANFASKRYTIGFFIALPKVFLNFYLIQF